MSNVHPLAVTVVGPGSETELQNFQPGFIPNEIYQLILKLEFALAIPASN